MPRYLVTWEIDYEGDGGPEAAARWAWEIMRKPHSTANAFTIIDEDGNRTDIDLQEIDEQAQKHYAHTPDRCPSNHWNDGTDTCGDCGANLKAGGLSGADR